jgi:hypothetical protein
MNIKVNQKSRRVQASLPKQLDLHKKSINQANYQIGINFVDENREILNTGTRTGRVYQTSAGKHIASAPGEAPSTITGRLAKSVDYSVHGWNKMSLGQKASYADFLESGTKRIKPRKNVILAINNIAGDAVNAYYQFFKRNNR